MRYRLREFAFTPTAFLLIAACVQFDSVDWYPERPSDTYAQMALVVSTVAIVPIAIAGNEQSESYTIADCFDEQEDRSETAIAVPVPSTKGTLWRRVCRQYDGIDLRDEPREALACFGEPISSLDFGHLYPLYQHPWVVGSEAPVCRDLVRRMRGDVVR